MCFTLLYDCFCDQLFFLVHIKGDLERLRRYWFQGACKSQKNKRNMSKPLDINQFMSAFLLLGCGILLTVILLALEHFYFRYCRRYLAKTEKADCFALVSLVSNLVIIMFNHFILID